MYKNIQINKFKENEINKVKKTSIPKINIPKKVNEAKSNNINDINEDIDKNNNIVKNQEGNNEQKDIISQNINKIFINNSQYNCIKKDYFMSRFQIIEILKKSKIISKGVISKTQADIILTKLNPQKRKYNLTDFKNFLTEICHYIYKEEFESSPQKLMNYFLNCLFNNYSQHLQEKSSKNFLDKKNENSCTIKCLETIITIQLEKPVCKLLLSLYDSFKKIYKLYFPEELAINIFVNKDLLSAVSSENIYKFSKDFEIVPYIINKTNLNTYFYLLTKYQLENPEITNIIMNCGDKKYKDMGIIFKLSTFILFIYHFSIFLYYKDFKSQDIKEIINIDHEAPSDIDIIFLFLEKLENSNGINKYLKKRGRTKDDKFTFIPKMKDINVSNEEMKREAKLYSLNNENENKLKSKNKNSNIESSPYTSRDITERKIENNDNYNNENTNKSFYNNNENLLKSNNFNEYFKEKGDEYVEYLPISELKNILNVSSAVKNDIIKNIENIYEIFLKYSKIHDKLEYNRMTASSFIQFLKDANIIYEVPEDKKNNYRKLSNRIITRNYNISEIKKFDNTLKLSVSCNNINLSKEEKKYRKNVSQIVNINDKKGKINLGEASLIFFSLTNSNNFPSNLNKIRTQFDKNTGYTKVNINSYTQKTFSFDKKRENFIKKNIPNKMNLVLFIKSFEFISEKLYPEMTLDDAMSNLLNKIIFPFIKERKINNINTVKMKDALSRINNNVYIKQFLLELKEIIFPLYGLYSDQNGNMKFYQFFEFYKYFELFPEFISLSQMKEIYFILCKSIYAHNNTNQTKIEHIDYDLFLESLVISSMFFNFKDIVSDIDRLLYLCYFIWKSDGIRNQKLEQNIPQKINRNFIELFKQYNKFEIDNNNKISKYNRTCSNPNLSAKKLVLTYSNIDKEYNCTNGNKEIYKFDDIYN